MTPTHVFVLLCVVWGLGETWLGARRRSEDAARTRDSGTLRLLLVTIYACIFIAVWLSYTGWGRWPDGTRTTVFWIGAVAMVVGLVVRWWSIRVLARFFTVDVAIRPGHELIRRGPYRWLRHPSYTGALLNFYGFGLMLGNTWSLLVAAVPVTIAFLWRMRIEERVLAEAFPDEYPDYARQTRRLIPFIW